MPDPATARTTSIAARASSGSCSRCASRPTPQALIPRLPDLIDALGSAISTDIPTNQLAPLLGLASQIDTKDIRSYVFAPPLYGTESRPGAPVYSIQAKVSKIRAAVKTAFTTDPADEAQRQDLASEGAAVWVLNGTSDPGFGTALSGYLEFHGLAASAPRQKPAGAVPANTVIVAYNGAETKMPDTIAYLQQTFGVTVTTKTDPAMPADIVITVGRNTPGLTAPAGPERPTLLDRGQPVLVFGQTAADRVEVAVPDQPSDRPDLPGPDRPMVDLDDRRDLDARAAQEHLLGDIQL